MHSESSLVNSNDIDINRTHTSTSTTSQPNLMVTKEPVNVGNINDNNILKNVRKGRNQGDKISLNVQSECAIHTPAGMENNDTGLAKSDETLDGNDNDNVINSTNSKNRIVRVESQSSSSDQEVSTIRRQFYDDNSETNLNTI